jgi:hypothetical protein
MSASKIKIMGIKKSSLRQVFLPPVAIRFKNKSKKLVHPFRLDYTFTKKKKIPLNPSITEIKLL